MVPRVSAGVGVCAEVRRRRPEVCTTRKLGVRRAIGAGVLLGAAAGAGGCAGDAAGMQGKKAVSGCCIVRAAATGVRRSAMYGGGSCQMSVRRRWDERGGDEGSGDEVGVARDAGWGTLLRGGVKPQEVLEESALQLSESREGG